MTQPLFLLLLFLISTVLFPFSFSYQSNSQNFETFYPFPIDFPPPDHPINPPKPNSSSPVPQPPALPQKSSSSNRTVAKAVAATAASTFVIATLIFLLIQRYVVSRRRRKEAISIHSVGDGRRPAVLDDSNNIEGLIVDENGLDVLYWKKLEEKNKTASSQKVDIDYQETEEEMVQERNGRRKNSISIQEIPLLRGKSSPSQNKVVPSQILDPPSAAPPPPPPPPAVPPRPPPIPIKVRNNSTPPPPPPPPPPAKKINSIPPPIPANKTNAPPPPIPANKNNAPPPPPPPKSSKLPSSGKGIASKSETEDSSTDNESGPVKLKPLHWDKVNKTTSRSMVWDRIGGGSFRVDDDLMEALFGYVATNKKSPKKGETSDNQNISPSAQITILDPRKSQNIAIVLKSLGVSREEILDALADGHGLNIDTLEKLVRIAPTNEEVSEILEFDGDPSRLADAENFLYRLLKAVPSAFTGLNAILFRLNYDSEIVQFKESLQTLELGCKELRNRGLFMKLLEAILKAGNRMNAGTSRGNAQAFDLTSLRKLSDVRSTDGKTNLLHFIVEEVVRSEGKRCVINRNRSLSRSSSRSSISSMSSVNLASKEERDKEYIMLGLPMVGGLSSEFSNVKKAAQIDYDAFAGTCSAITARIAEVRPSTTQGASNWEEGFAKEMTGFLETAEEEIKSLRCEQNRIMEIVQKTTEYYQAGASKKGGAHPLQLFVIIKNFLSMVDQACIEIARNLQKRRTQSSNLGSSPKSPPTPVVPIRFPNLPEHFMKEKSGSSSSESDTDF